MPLKSVSTTEGRLKASSPTGYGNFTGLPEETDVLSWANLSNSGSRSFEPAMFEDPAGRRLGGSPFALRFPTGWESGLCGGELIPLTVRLALDGW